MPRWDMSFLVGIFTILTALTKITFARRNSTFFGLALKGANITRFEIVSLGTYQVLRADIYQDTVDVSTNVSVLTTRETFSVVVSGTTSGSLPVRCKASWLTIATIYPAIVPFECVDQTVNVTLLQGEVWPEYGGFFLFVEQNGANPAAWMVGNHLSTAPGWSYEPMTNESWPPMGHWTWSGKQIIDTMPTVSLPNWIGYNSTDP